MEREVAADEDDMDRPSTSGTASPAPTQRKKCSVFPKENNSNDMIQEAYGIMTGLSKRYTERDEH